MGRWMRIKVGGTGIPAEGDAIWLGHVPLVEPKNVQAHQGMAPHPQHQACMVRGRFPGAGTIVPRSGGEHMQTGEHADPIGCESEQAKVHDTGSPTGAVLRAHDRPGEEPG